MEKVKSGYLLFKTSVYYLKEVSIYRYASVITIPTILNSNKWFE